MAVSLMVTSLEALDESIDGRVAWERVRNEVIVRVFGARAGFGDGTREDEHRFRIDDHCADD